MARLIEQRASFHDAAARGALTLALTLTAALSVGCSLDLSGLPGSGGEAGSTTTGPGVGGAGGVAAVTATSTGSVTSTASSSSTAPPCTKTSDTEACDDGMDNDCNGTTDCEDPACQSGFVCTPTIPSGWTAVAFSAQDRPDCPTGYGKLNDIVSAPATAIACSCSCSEQQAATCLKGTLSLDSNGTSCPGGASFFLDAKNSSCASTNLSTVNGGKVKIAPLPPTQGVCSGAPQSTILPPIQGRFCAVDKTGTGCTESGSVCVMKASAPFASCIEHDGSMSCPSGFPNDYSVGTSADDTRSCSACACATNATCSNPKLTLYSDNNCMTGAHDLPVTNSCDPVNDGNGHAYSFYRYTAAITNGSCQTITSSMPAGSLTLVGKSTVCCQ